MPEPRSEIVARPVVRPNRYDSRERRLEDDLSDLVRQVRKRHPEDFDGPDTLANLGLRVAVLRADRELSRPRSADLDGRVRHPLVRWWRDMRTPQSGSQGEDR